MFSAGATIYKSGKNGTRANRFSSFFSKMKFFFDFSIQIAGKAAKSLLSDRQDRAFRFYYDPEGPRSSHFHA